MKVLVTGAEGQLGHDVTNELKMRGIECVAAGKGELDITDAELTDSFFNNEKPDAVIHCAAYTCVDKAETERERCEAVNVSGTSNVARACQRCGAKLLYVSSEYVYGDMGDTPLETSSVKNPVNFYGYTKLEGEKAAMQCPKLFIVRISWAFGKNGCNFVKTMLNNAKTSSSVMVVADQIGSPTYTKDLSVLLCDMISSEKYGVYNASNEGVCTWADFAMEIFRLAGKEIEVVHVTTEEYAAPARRQKNSVMSKKSLDDAGFNRLPHWKDALERFMKYEISEKYVNTV